MNRLLAAAVFSFCLLLSSVATAQAAASAHADGDSHDSAAVAPTRIPTPAPNAEIAPMPTATIALMPTAMPMPRPTAVPAQGTTASPLLRPLLAPPVALKLDGFYRKHLDAGGLPIISSENVMDAALYRARGIIDEMLFHRPELRAVIAGTGARVTVVADTEIITDVPEFKDIYKMAPGIDWVSRVQGGGLASSHEQPTTAVWSANLICGQGDVFPYEDVFVHEFAHTILKMGIERQPGGAKFRRRLETAYRGALKAGLWLGTYASENADEYWAEGVQSWFGLNDVPGIFHNDINTRAELKTYDPTLANLIHEVFGETTISSSCHETLDIQKDYRIEGKVVGPDGKPVAGLVIWAWQGQALTSGCEYTAADGTFNIKVPTGTFTLNLYLEEASGLEFVGWHDGVGVTKRMMNAAVFEVADGNIGGIVIRLPQRLG